MPATYAHYKFGKDVLGTLPRPLQQAVENNREMFDIGLHGPDILFYYKALKSNPVSQMGNALHVEMADIFFERGLKVIGEASDPAAARAYMYGFICHFALDSECHKYVEKMIQVSGISHTEIEMEFDRYLLTGDYINPVTHLSVRHIHPTLKNAEVIAPFFNEFPPEILKKCLSSMIMYHKLFLVPGQKKRKALFMAMKVLGKYESMHGIVMSEKANPQCEGYCLLLKKLYAGAVPLAVDLIIKFQKAVFQEAKLPGRFHETFGAGENWEELPL